MIGTKVRFHGQDGKVVAASCLAMIVIGVVVLALNLVLLAGAVWVVVKVLQAMGVL